MLELLAVTTVLLLTVVEPGSPPLPPTESVPPAPPLLLVEELGAPPTPTEFEAPLLVTEALLAVVALWPEPDSLLCSPCLAPKTRTSPVQAAIIVPMLKPAKTR